MAVTRDEIIWAYRMIFGREPESEEAIKSHEGFFTINDLRCFFISSPEFFSKNCDMKQYRFDQYAEPMKVQLDISEEDLGKILSMTQSVWQQFGKTEPHWSVLTHDDFRSESISFNKEQFYESGIQSAKMLFDALKRNGLDKDKFKSILEIGCGVGRITRYFAKEFEKVCAVDISNNHLALAKDLCASDENIQYVHIKDIQQYQKLPKSDIVYSVIVLQHNPPPIIEILLESMFDRLSAGGVAFFQVPVYKKDYQFITNQYLLGAGHDMEMHCIQQKRIFEIANAYGCIPVEVFEDSLAEPFISNTFTFLKNSK